MCPVGYGVHSSAAEILTKRWHGSVARPSAVFPRRQAECLFPAEPCAQLSGPRRRGGQPRRVAGHSAPRLPMSALVPYKPFSASSRFRKASIDRAIALLYTLFFFFFWLLSVAGITCQLLGRPIQALPVLAQNFSLLLNLLSGSLSASCQGLFSVPRRCSPALSSPGTLAQPYPMPISTHRPVAARRRSWECRGEPRVLKTTDLEIHLEFRERRASDLKREKRKSRRNGVVA